MTQLRKDQNGKKMRKKNVDGGEEVRREERKRMVIQNISEKWHKM